MPGVEVCGRCAAALNLTSMAVDVHPPRAGRRAKRRRKWFAALRKLATLPELLLTPLENQFGPMDVQRPAMSIVPRMVVPGWPQMHCGRTSRGRIFLIGYLATLLPGLVLVGSSAGSVLLGLALALHASSVLDVVFAGAPMWSSRATQSLLYLLLLAGVVYVPAGWAITRVATPRMITHSTPPFLAGDVFLFNRAAYYWGEPCAGDVVYYRIPEERVTGRTLRGNAAVYQIGGERIDRVLAGPGRSVRWENGRLSVDGQPSPWLPLNPDAVSETVTLVVPGDAYFIVPSTDPLPSTLRPSEITRLTSVVQADCIMGKVFVRSYPMSRFWMVD